MTTVPNTGRRAPAQRTIAAMRLFLFLVLGCSLLLAPESALARRSQTQRYEYSRVWSASVRYLRVELGLEIRDKDEETGFILFDYRSGGRTVPGSLEFVRQSASDQVQVTIHLQGMPGYMESLFLERLTRKLREEYGEPLAVARPARASTRDAAQESDDVSAEPAESSSDAGTPTE